MGSFVFHSIFSLDQGLSVGLVLGDLKEFQFLTIFTTIDQRLPVHIRDLLVPQSLFPR